MADDSKSAGQMGMGLGVVIGLAISLGMGLLLLIGGLMYVKHERRAIRAGWNLVPVIVAADDIAPDTTLTYDMISQRAVPEQFVTTSIAKPDRANELVGKRLKVPVKAGDPLLWTEFDDFKPAPPQCDDVPGDQGAARDRDEVVRSGALSAVTTRG